MIEDQKSVTHESKYKLAAVLLPEKPKSQNNTGMVVPVMPQHLLPYTQNNRNWSDLPEQKIIL